MSLVRRLKNAGLSCFELLRRKEQETMALDFNLTEELARGSCGFAMSVIMQILMGTYFIARFGNENIKQRILVPAIKGEKIGTICFTEDPSGSDLGGARTLRTQV